jgi:hypothetical protein
MTGNNNKEDDVDGGKDNSSSSTANNNVNTIRSASASSIDLKELENIAEIKRRSGY